MNLRFRGSLFKCFLSLFKGLQVALTTHRKSKVAAALKARDHYHPSPDYVGSRVLYTWKDTCRRSPGRQADPGGGNRTGGQSWSGSLGKTKHRRASLSHCWTLFTRFPIKHFINLSLDCPKQPLPSLSLYLTYDWRTSVNSNYMKITDTSIFLNRRCNQFLYCYLQKK